VSRYPFPDHQCVCFVFVHIWGGYTIL
jgi:hypothetical protein